MNDKKFDEIKDGVVQSLKDLITTEMPDPQIEKITGIITAVEKDLSERHDEITQQAIDYKSKLIDGIKNFGTPKAPIQEDTPTGRSLEEIANEIISKKNA